MGYKVLEYPAIGVEGGRDILVERSLKDDMGERKERVIIQCKHHAHSGKAVNDRDLGIWQNAITRYQARGYLLVTDVRVTENISRTFREFTNDEANYPKWASFWDVDTLTSHLYRHSTVKDAFFARSSESDQAHLALADEVHSWLQAIRYNVEKPKTLDGRTTDISAAVRAPFGSKAIRIRCVDGEISSDDARNFYLDLENQPIPGWLISDTRVSDRARQFAMQHPVLEVLTFGEFIQKIAWGPTFHLCAAALRNKRLGRSMLILRVTKSSWIRLGRKRAAINLKAWITTSISGFMNEAFPN